MRRATKALAPAACLALLCGTFTAGQSPPPRKASPRTDLHGDPLPAGAVARFGTARFTHPDGADLLLFSPDGKTLVGGSTKTRRVRAWDAATGKFVGRREGERPRLPAAFTADGKVILVGTGPSCQLWDPATGWTRDLFDGEGAAARLAAVSPDGKTVALAFETEVALVDATTGRERDRRIVMPRADGQVLALAFGGDGRRLAVGWGFGNVLLWDCVRERRLRWYNTEDPQALVTAVALRPDGKALAVASHGDKGGTVVMYETDSEGELDGFTAPEDEATFTGLRFTSDGKELIGFTDRGRLFRWDAASGKQRAAVGEAQEAECAVALDPAGHTVAVTVGTGLQLFDAGTGKARTAFGGQPALGTAAFVGDAGTEAACADARGRLHFWDAATGKPGRVLAELVPQQPNVERWPALSPDGARALTWADEFKSVRLVDARTGKDVWKADTGADDVTLPTFAPDGRQFAVVTDSAEEGRAVEVWDAVTGKRRRTFAVKDTQGAPLLAWAPDGRSLVVLDTGSGRAVVWEVATQRARDRFEVTNAAALAFLPDGKRLAVATQLGGTLLVRLGVDVPAERHPPRASLRSLAASPDGRWLAGGDSDGILYVWEVDGRKQFQVQGHDSGVTAVAFAADSRRLVTAGEDGTALVWDLRAMPDRPASPEVPRPVALAKCWEALAGADAAAALRAVAALEGRPAEAVALLEGRLRPAAPVDRERLGRLVQDLGGDFKARRNAARELEALGDRAEGALRAAFAKPASAEAKRQAKGLLRKLDGPVTDAARLRELRALELLERLGTAGARRLLERLAGGAPEARLTREAQASLRRLAKRRVVAP